MHRTDRPRQGLGGEALRRLLQNISLQVDKVQQLEEIAWEFRRVPPALADLILMVTKLMNLWMPEHANDPAGLGVGAERKGWIHNENNEPLLRDWAIPQALGDAQHQHDTLRTLLVGMSSGQQLLLDLVNTPMGLTDLPTFNQALWTNMQHLQHGNINAFTCTFFGHRTDVTRRDEINKSEAN